MNERTAEPLLLDLGGRDELAEILGDAVALSDAGQVGAPWVITWPSGIANADQGGLRAPSTGVTGGSTSVSNKAGACTIRMGGVNVVVLAHLPTGGVDELWMAICEQAGELGEELAVVSRTVLIVVDPAVHGDRAVLPRKAANDL